MYGFGRVRRQGLTTRVQWCPRQPCGHRTSRPTRTEIQARFRLIVLKQHHVPDQMKETRLDGRPTNSFLIAGCCTKNKVKKAAGRQQVAQTRLLEVSLKPSDVVRPGRAGGHPQSVCRSRSRRSSGSKKHSTQFASSLKTRTFRDLAMSCTHRRPVPKPFLTYASSTQHLLP